MDNSEFFFAGHCGRSVRMNTLIQYRCQEWVPLWPHFPFLPPWHKYLIMYVVYYNTIRSQWPRVLRRRSADARLLGLRVRIPPAEWMFLLCHFCALSVRGLYVGLITRPEESYRMWCFWVWSWNLNNMETLAHWGLSRHGVGGNKNLIFYTNYLPADNYTVITFISVSIDCYIRFTGWSKSLSALDDYSTNHQVHRDFLITLYYTDVSAGYIQLSLCRDLQTTNLTQRRTIICL
jgi:hypothetical protein